MPVIHQLFLPPGPRPEPGTHYVRLVQVIPDHGPQGRYVRLVCEGDDGISLQARANESEFEALDPYYELLLQSHASSAVEPPVVPIFREPDGGWHFSSRSAQQDYPQEAPLSPEGEGFDHLFLKVPKATALSLYQAAMARGFSTQEFLLHLIRSSLS